MNWIIVAVLVILAFVFLRMRHMKHKVFLIVFILVLLFIYTTGSRVLTGYDINWKSASGVEKGLKAYFAWFGGVFGNFKSITANAIKMDWSTNNTDIKISEQE